MMALVVIAIWVSAGWLLHDGYTWNNHTVMLIAVIMIIIGCLLANYGGKDAN
jgi:low affinity Fe/Cu permease